MKLVAIYNVWDGVELLRGSIDCIKNHVDVIIIVWQKKSNVGEEYNPFDEIDISGLNCAFTVEFIPDLSKRASENERDKRNLGLEFAKGIGCTHFLCIDCDEYYENFGWMKQQFIQSGASGSVCPIFTYFKRPEWRCDELDGYHVPFIHKLTPQTRMGENPSYPFYVDPTRNVNCNGLVIKMDYPMHHFSWVRKDINRKIRNSSASRNIMRGTLIEDWDNPMLNLHPAGYYIRDWERKIVVVENTFGIKI